MQTLQTSIKTLLLLVFTLTLQSLSFAEGTVTKTYSVKEFSTLKISSAFKVEFIHSSENKVIVEVDEKLDECVYVANAGNDLVIKLKDCYKNNIHTMTAKVYGNSLSAIYLSGASSFISDYTFVEKEILLKNSGASKIEISLKTEKLDIELSGASKMEVSGTATKQTINASGASNYNGKDCKNKDTDVSASGASKITVDCSDTLDVKASGASSVKYVNEPKTINKVLSGASNVKMN